ncbi:hypothetical protein H4R33_004254 [Dimargaris cristalligena]|uniref:Origin recognition complex subunit 5 n=1 Tax=Dimargaris cristalligena TaxID=215637 RepID=A0A4Q0A372_9FUNG|nr:hypothetical protein H4R33_004254 [Dimargaris cristalligena]RKP39700.1 origin recognition complex subunit 5-like protein [Dimargaris cristalligena]|eukprot:RKP39700.1 origin recognition complex subunit 5-like protein [Dimargaris cristalligena]
MTASTVNLTLLRRSAAQRFPGREPQVDQLLRYLGQPADTSPPFLFIYGHESTGKTSIVRFILSEIFDSTHAAYISCVECYTPRLVFEHILKQLGDSHPSFETGFLSNVKCDSMQEFISFMRRLDGAHQLPRYIVFDNAEKLRDMGPTFLPAFLRIAELTDIPTTIILISCVPWDKFRPRNGIQEPLLVRFPIYGKEDTMKILALKCPSDEPLDFYLSFISVVYDVFSRNCKDINELRHLVALLFPKFCEPLFDGRAKRSEVPKLFRLCQTYFAAAADKLYLREISSAEWLRHIRVRRPGDDSDDNSSDPEDSGTSILGNPIESDALHLRIKTKLDFDLPYYTKFLLIASFLASYNPARLDVRFFSKGKESTSYSKRGKQAIQKQMMSNTGGKHRQQLLGPKSFPIERMLAIFYSILVDPIENSIEIQSQIASLVTLRLLVRTSNASQLDGIKCKCNVSYELIRHISHSVQFEIENYLFDFI